MSSRLFSGPARGAIPLSHASSPSPSSSRLWPHHSSINPRSPVPIQVAHARKRTSASESDPRSTSGPDQKANRSRASELASPGGADVSSSSSAASSTSSSKPPAPPPLSMPPPSGPHCLLPAAEATLLHMSAAPSGFGAVPLAYAKGTVKPRKGWRSTWRGAAAAATGGAAAPSSAAFPPRPAPAAAPRSWATLPPPTKNAGSGKPASSAKIAAPFSRYPRKANSAAAFLANSTSSSTPASPSAPFSASSSSFLSSSSYQNLQQQQIPVVYRSAPYRREAEREKVEFRDLEETSPSSSPSLTPRVLFVDDGGGARARLAAALFASAVAEAFPAGGGTKN